MWKCFWDWLATLPQGSASFVGTLTGSALGLIALLLGALFNAHLNRRRDDRLRNVDRQTVVVALHAELSSIEKTLLDNAKHLIEKPPEEGGGFLVPDIMHSSLVFQDMLPKIGLLDPRRLVSLPTGMKSFAVEYNRGRAGVVKEAINALAQYLKDR